MKRQITERPKEKEHIAIVTIEIHADDTNAFNTFAADLQKLAHEAADKEYDIYIDAEQ